MCTPQWLGDRAVCKKGQCAVVQAKRQAASKGQLRCNVKSKVCHRPGCRHYRCKNCTVTFASEAAAVKAGYQVHRKR